MISQYKHLQHLQLKGRYGHTLCLVTRFYLFGIPIYKKVEQKGAAV